MSCEWERGHIWKWLEQMLVSSINTLYLHNLLVKFSWLIFTTINSPQTLYHYQPSCYILVLLILYITTNHHATYWFFSDSISIPTIMLHTGSPQTISIPIIMLNTGSPQTLYHYQPSCYILVLLRLSISLPTIMLHTGSPQILYQYQPSCYILVLLILYITTRVWGEPVCRKMVGSDIEYEENQYVAWWLVVI
jgi:hypothetical protein